MSAPMAVDPALQISDRDAQMDVLMSMTELIYSKLPNDAKTSMCFNKPVKIDIDLSNQISGVLCTLFSHLRRTERTDPTADKYYSYKQTIAGTELDIGALGAEVRANLAPINFISATPIMNIITAFKCFYDEVRVGVTKFKVREDVARASKKRKLNQGTVQNITAEDRVHNLSMYGLNNQHAPLLQGITLAPERRTGLLRSLGPLTQCILLLNEGRYTAKICDALKNSIQMLPMANEVASLLRDQHNPGMVQAVLKELGDILLMTTARQTQKVYMPLLLTLFLWANRDKTVAWNSSGSNIQIAITKAVELYELKFVMASTKSTGGLAQAVFHAMFGTYLDDLSLLPQITTWGAWATRSELKETFVKIPNAPKFTFTPIVLTRFAKMAQALLTRNIGNSEPCMSTRPSFSGLQIKRYSNDFLSYLRTGSILSSYSSDPIQLHSALRKMKDEIRNGLEQNPNQELGTKKWMKLNAAGIAEETDEVFTGIGKSFFGHYQ